MAAHSSDSLAASTTRHGRSTLSSKLIDSSQFNDALPSCRFFQSYAASNISFWGFTIENEPSAGVFSNYKWQAMLMTPEIMRDFIKMDLGPALHEVNLNALKMMIVDDNRLLINTYADRVSFSDSSNIQLLNRSSPILSRAVMLMVSACTGTWTTIYRRISCRPFMSAFRTSSFWRRKHAQVMFLNWSVTFAC